MAYIFLSLKLFYKKINKLDEFAISIIFFYTYKYISHIIIKGSLMKLLFVSYSLIILLPFSINAMENSATQKWNGDYYDDNSDPQFNTAEELVRTKITLTNLCDCNTILDVGCGTGKMAYSLHYHTPPSSEVIGIDAAESMVTKAKEKYKAQQDYGLNFQVMDAQALTFTNKFDLVTSFNTAHWIQNKATLFQGISRALKPGGILLMTGAVKRPDKPTALMAALMGLKNNKNWESFLSSVKIDDEYFPFESKETVEELLKKNNFTDVTIDVDTKPYTFKDEQALAQWFGGFFGGFHSFNRLKNDDQKRFLNDVAHEYVHIVPKKDNLIEYQRAPLIIMAKKAMQP